MGKFPVSVEALAFITNQLWSVISYYNIRSSISTEVPLEFLDNSICGCTVQSVNFQEI